MAEVAGNIGPAEVGKADHKSLEGSVSMEAEVEQLVVEGSGSVALNWVETGVKTEGEWECCGIAEPKQPGQVVPEQEWIAVD
jgi:hypothetical protein